MSKHNDKLVLKGYDFAWSNKPCPIITRWEINRKIKSDSNIRFSWVYKLDGWKFYLDHLKKFVIKLENWKIGKSQQAR